MSPQLPPMRVVVHDPNPFLAGSIRRALHSAGPFEAVASSADLPGAVGSDRPDVVLIDPAHVDGPLADWVAGLRAVHPDCDLLGYVAPGDRPAALRCLSAGFAGVIPQDADLETIVEALTTVGLGGVYVERSFAAAVGPQPTPGDASPDSLSVRERFVLEQVARGFSSKEIALRLGLSPKTVETHRSRAAGKLGLRRKSEIVSFAIRNAWLDGALAS